MGSLLCVILVILGFPLSSHWRTVASTSISRKEPQAPELDGLRATNTGYVPRPRCSFAHEEEGKEPMEIAMRHEHKKSVNYRGLRPSRNLGYRASPLSSRDPAFWYPI